MHLQVGDEQFNWALQQLVDLSYPWSTPGDALPALPLQLPLPSIIMYGSTAILFWETDFGCQHE